MSLIDKRIVEQRFSKAAGQYDNYSNLHKEIAANLFSRISNPYLKPSRILDIGMGTGILTEKIAAIYPQAQIYGIDLAWGMLEVVKQRANNIYLIQADAESLPFKKKSFDLIFSNLAFQWLPNLEEVFAALTHLLNSGGRLILSSFTQDSLLELSNTLNQFLNRSRLKQLPSETEIKSFAKNCGFIIKKTEVYQKRVYFSDVYNLVRWLKNIGANYSPAQFVGKTKWAEINNFYRQNFSANGKVYATFKVIEVELTKDE